MAKKDETPTPAATPKRQDLMEVEIKALVDQRLIYCRPPGEKLKMVVLKKQGDTATFKVGDIKSYLDPDGKGGFKIKPTWQHQLRVV